MLRESWEEIILKDEFDKHALQNWRSVHASIMKESNKEEKFFSWIKSQLQKVQAVTYGNCALRTIYYIINISLKQANHLIEKHGMIPFAVDYMTMVVEFNKKDIDLLLICHL